MSRPTEALTYEQGEQIARQLEQHYDRVRKDYEAIAHTSAEEAVRSIAAQSEGELRRVMEDALRRRSGEGWSPGSLVPRSIPSAAVGLLIVLALGYVAVKGVPWGGPAEDSAAAGSPAGAGSEAVPLPPVPLETLYAVAAARYDTLFARRDSVLVRLVEGALEPAAPAEGDAEGDGGEDAAAAPGGAGSPAGAGSERLAGALATWRAGMASAGDEDMVHAALLEVALRARAMDDLPVDGRIDRKQCEDDEACAEVFRLWREDRKGGGTRLLPPIPDGRTPSESQLRLVEKVIVYAHLAAGAR